MELDARRLRNGTVLDTDLCIVGAGPAGITLAREFLGRDIQVLLLESGGRTPDESAQALNEGSVAGDPYAGLRETRYRGVGGTVARWNTPVPGGPGAKYVPLDPWDFDPPRTGGLTGWPLPFEELLEFYPRAQEVCALGRFEYETADAPAPTPALPGPADLLVPRLYRFASGKLFASIYPGQFRASANLTLCINATVSSLSARPGMERNVEAALVSLADRQITVRAKRFVLAGGAIENARLLLMAELGTELTGRCFMEHPRDRALTLLPGDPGLYARMGFHDIRSSTDGGIIGGRLALAEAAVRTLGHPNASLTLLPRPRERRPPSGMAHRLSARLRSWIAPPPPLGGYGWSSLTDPARFFDAFRIVINLEQRPDPENRITLGESRDALGLPLPRLYWRWRADEQQELQRLRDAVRAALPAMGLGPVEIDPLQSIDPNAHHHSGTTRMAHDPRDGVVDPDGRVHGTRNLYVTGASVFPTTGFANPTLTVVALAIRLAEHLKGTQ